MASIPEIPVSPAASCDEQSGLEERRALIERVAASEQFSRSVRLRDFLLYVGRQSLRPDAPEIHEQEIGEQVFGRPSSYDRSQDNIVRVNATELRKRIELYFATTGAHEPLLFEIPRGSYKPVFRRRQPAGLPAFQLPADSAAPVRAEADASAGGGRHVLMAVHGAWAAVCLMLALACVFLFQQAARMRKMLEPWTGQPAVAMFWSGFINPHRQTDVVLPDDSISVIEDITGAPVFLPDYLSRGFLRRIQSSAMSGDRKQDLTQIFNHNLVTFGAVKAAQMVLGEIPPGYPRYLTLARNFTADDVMRDNVVLVGGKKAVPWDHLFDNQLNFVTDYDDVRGLGFVRNRNPRAGEQPRYDVSSAPDSLTGYATIAYLPNPNHTGRTLIIAGTDSDATGAAAAFLTSEDQMNKLLRTLHASRFPYFEVALKTSRLSGTFFDAELIAYRSYPGL
jgi:hypothetical protein